MKAVSCIAVCILSLTSYSQINSYSIDLEIDGPGILYFDLDSNGQDDFYFDIIELNPGIFAARVTNVGLSSYLDNSTFNYPDALNLGDPVSGYFNTGNAVLGTFTGAGLFSGAGDKYLGIRINDGANSYDGWILLNCNSTNDTLKIISYGYHTIPGNLILAGQTFVNSMAEYSAEELLIYPNPVFSDLMFSDEVLINFSAYEIFNTNGEIITEGNLCKNISFSLFPPGLYFIKLKNDYTVVSATIIVSK